MEGDARLVPWGEGYDVVAMSNNALLELGTEDDQRRLVVRAAEALAPGGTLLLSFDDYKGELDRPGGEGPFRKTGWVVFEGRGEDGSHGRLTARVLGYEDGRLTIRRTWRRTVPGLALRRWEMTTVKRLVRAAEARAWIGAAGLEILGCLGDWDGTPFDPTSRLAVFLARRPDRGSAGGA